MDRKALVGVAALGLAVAAVSTTWGQDTGDNGENGNGGNGNGDTEPKSVTVKLTVQNGGQARFVIDGNPEQWTDSSYSLEVDPNTQVNVEVEPDSGYKFKEYKGQKPPYTVSEVIN